jgi:hypothetical protein
LIDIAGLLNKQRDLQVGSFRLDPLALEGEDRAEFIRWNVLALEDELHEMLGEVGWKPWASSRHVNEKEATAELVDALHFFLNLVLAAAPRGQSVEMAAHTLLSGYNTKAAVNARRQANGYDGVTGKCPDCKRDTAETELVVYTDLGATSSCPCGHVYGAVSG